jgi:hypothetical protein
MMYYRLQSQGAPAVASQNAIVKSLAKNAPSTQNGITPKSPHKNSQFNRFAAQGKICGSTHIPALNSATVATAIGTEREWRTRSQPYLNALSLRLDRLYRKAIGRKARWSKSMVHLLTLR